MLSRKQPAFPTTESPPNGMSEVTKWQRGPSHPLATWGSHPEATQEINGQCLPASPRPLNPQCSPGPGCVLRKGRVWTNGEARGGWVSEVWKGPSGTQLLRQSWCEAQGLGIVTARHGSPDLGWRPGAPPPCSEGFWKRQNTWAWSPLPQ